MSWRGTGRRARSGRTGDSAARHPMGVEKEGVKRGREKCIRYKGRTMSYTSDKYLHDIISIHRKGEEVGHMNI